MRSIIKLIASLLLFLNPSQAEAQSAPYRPKELSDMRFHFTQKDTIIFNGTDSITATVSIKDGMEDDSYYLSKYIMDHGIQESWNILSWFLDVHEIPPTFCRGDEYNINFYIVDLYLLTDRTRFRDIYSAPTVQMQGGYAMYAYYDPTPNINNNSTIVISDVSYYINIKDVVHEMTHYWWDRMCLSSKLSDYNTESFARKIEYLYSIYQPRK